jgi:hypothetical protein
VFSLTIYVKNKIFSGSTNHIKSRSCVNVFRSSQDSLFISWNGCDPLGNSHPDMVQNSSFQALPQAHSLQVSLTTLAVCRATVSGAFHPSRNRPAGQNHAETSRHISPQIVMPWLSSLRTTQKRFDQKRHPFSLLHLFLSLMCWFVWEREHNPHLNHVRWL